MVNHPVIDVLVPNSYFFIFFVLIWRNEILTNNLLKFQLICKFIDGVKHVVSLSIEILLSCVQEFLSFVILYPDSLELFRFEIELLLDTVELVLGV